MRCPSELLQHGEFSDCMDVCIGSGAPQLNVVNPAFDYVPPELVSLFITDMYDHSKSLVILYAAEEDIIHHSCTGSLLIITLLTIWICKREPLLERAWLRS
ncbi:hypothetical protein SADUNF_Sadunf10G0040000 [Salix dunnii]|uniref:Translation initiation factor eIF2B subunit beta n=1 Tax=Salix dunnii TaxID=1413687 RepID=A0A835JM45_9ROSI|nr:hypothetical protein SADUNF_Sadunf10G0040000 [Salix dunnii]